MPMIFPTKDHNFLTKGCLVKDLFNLRQKDRINYQHPGATVIQHIEEILGLHQHIGRYGHGPELDGSKE